MSEDNFIQNNGFFAWFTGVIEDIDDPLQRGRYRVRCYGYHTDDRGKIAKEFLPWAHVIMPPTSASVSGIGESATGLVRGSWVVGFFRDGPNGQDPIIMGSIPAQSSAVDYSRGFTDESERYPSSDKLSVPDIPVEARSRVEEGQTDPAYKTGYAYIQKSKFRADVKRQKVGGRELASSINSVHTSDGNTWSLLKLDDILAPLYPANHVKSYERKGEFITETTTTENNDGTAQEVTTTKFLKEPDGDKAHVVEFDTTPGKERISTMHRSGTYHEFTSKGDQEVVVNGSDYQVIHKNKNVYVRGNCNLTIDGNCNTLIEGDWDIQVNGNKNERVAGTMTQQVTGAVSETYQNTQTTTVSSSLKETVGGTHTVKSSGNLKVTAPRIDLN